ncbi:MAG: hypothetical protein J5849_02095, partial [Clostridia bacterium]|nr:hypothetical protein [Clostridia bacterium]
MKNKMMRIASVLMVAALLSTCVISGTFAKYVKSASAGDTARVAKFGVVITAEGELFATEYDLEEELLTDASFEHSVESSDEDKLVAPGTSGEAGGITITGTPEVAVRIGVAATVTLSAWEVTIPVATAEEEAPADEKEEAPATKAETAETETVYYCPLEITVGTT